MDKNKSKSKNKNKNKTSSNNRIVTISKLENRIPNIPKGLTIQQYHIRRRCPYIWLEWRKDE